MSETIDELKQLIVRQKANAVRMQRIQYKAESLIKTLPMEFDKLAGCAKAEKSELSDFPKALTDHLEGRLAAIEASAETVKTDGEHCIEQITNINLREFVQNAESTAHLALERIETDVFPALASLLDSALREAVSHLEQRTSDLAGEWETGWTTTQATITDAQIELADMKDRLEEAFIEFTNIDVDELLSEAAQKMLGNFGETVSNIIQRIENLKSDITKMVDRLNSIMEIFRRAREAKDLAQTSAGTGIELVSEILNDLTDILKSV